MTRRLLRLISSYQDLCDRYGAEDPIVKDMAAEIIVCESDTHADSHSERRKEKFKKYNWTRQTPNMEQRAVFLH